MRRAGGPGESGMFAKDGTWIISYVSNSYMAECVYSHFTDTGTRDQRGIAT